MKQYDIKDNAQEYKIGESYIFLTYDLKEPEMIIKKVGTISATGITSDAIPYIEVNMSGVIKKYVTSILSKKLYDGFKNNMLTIPDPSILGEVTIVRKTIKGAADGDVTRVKGLPGDVTKVNKPKPTGDITIIRDKK